MTIYGEAFINNKEEYVEFKLDVILEGTNYKRPKVRRRIMDISKPENVGINLYTKCEDCCREGQIFNISLNNLNYTTTLEYDIITSIINITTYTKIDKYYYTETFYREETPEIRVNESFDNIIIKNMPYCSKEKKNITKYDEIFREIPNTNFNSEPYLINK